MKNSEIVTQNLDLIEACVSNQMFKHRNSPLVHKSDSKFLKDELTQELVLQMLEMPNKKLNKIFKDGRLNAWLTRVIILSLTSPTAPFYKQFFKFIDNCAEPYEGMKYDDEPVQKISVKSKRWKPSFKELKECLVVDHDETFMESDTELVIKAINELEPTDRNLLLCWVSSGSSLNFCRGMWNIGGKNEDRALRKEFLRIDRKVLDAKVQEIISRLKARINELRRWEH